MKSVQAAADALCRSAVECCRQHDRSAKLSSTDDQDLEQQQVDALCAMCDGSVEALAEAYMKAAAYLQPDRDEDWWHKANSLWHASREYARRQAGSNELAKSIAAKHNPERLADMQMEYELEASALLGLRHAAAAYQKTRPGLT